MTNDRSRAIPAEGDTLKVQIFYSHAAEDQKHQETLEKHLAILRQTGRIKEWHNRKIPVGEHRDYKIKEELAKADIILLLITPNFIASDYCYSTEMTFAIQAYEKGLVRVIPLLIETSGWQETPLAGFQALPRNRKSIYENATAATTSGPLFKALVEEEWQKIAQEITETVKQLQNSPDNLRKNREARFALGRSEVRQEKFPDSINMPPDRKEKPFLRLLVVLVIVLLMGFGGAILALHWTSGGIHGSPSANLTTTATTNELTPQSTFPETTGGNASTWTNYSSGSGNPGLVIPSYTTVQITCKVIGLKVGDGDMWWYRIASPPWDNKYYVSADAFYNNGQTSGPFGHSLLVDKKVPNC